MISLKQRGLICENLSRTASGELCLAGVPLSPLAARYGTPLYLYDEERIRERCRTYREAMKSAFGADAKVFYASKAASFRRLYEIVGEEGLGIDVVSCGEIRTAELAGFPLSRAYFHSNNKTDADIAYAIEREIGAFVVDNVEELHAIERAAAERGIKQRVLLRITPGVDPHTYSAVATGRVDSKFGSAIETGQAEEITRVALSLPHLALVGFHCHVGSQIFDSSVYRLTSDVMLKFIADVYFKTGYLAAELDLGGGLGVRYVEAQPTLDVFAVLAELSESMKRRAASLGIPLPRISVEPGRSIVADSGVTLYTVGTVKRITGYKTYVSVDGGMSDNPRFALYGAPYTILPVVESAAPEELCSVVGRCCESGDILQENVPLPESVKRGDLLACLTTGAYHYSMASNYNRLPRPAVVMLSQGSSYLAVRRESLEDLTVLDV